MSWLRAQRERHVAPEIFDADEPYLVTRRFPGTVHSAEAEVCPAPRFVRWHARAHVLRGLLIHVEPQFLVESLVEVSWPEQTAQSSRADKCAQIEELTFTLCT